ncbi:MAG: CoA-binding protein [Myxococcota bacterium]|nr:CoA-binding protein [Myxococcota bacterium]
MEDSALRDLLRGVRSIAVVGIKNGETEDAFRVPRYLQEQGYRILAVNPRLESVLGEPAHATLAEVGEPIDLVNVFRAPQHVPAHADEVLALRPLPRAVWMQLGIAHAEASQRLRDAGVQVVEDRCIMVDHRRLCGAT